MNSFELARQEFDMVIEKLKVCKEPADRRNLPITLRQILVELDRLTRNNLPTRLRIYLRLLMIADLIRDSCARLLRLAR